jgi:homoserine O-acetyltransferase
MNWAVPIAASQKAGGRMLGIFGMMSYSIRTDPAYMNGAYTVQPREGLRRGLMHTYLWNFGAPWYDEQFKTEAQVMKAIEDAGRDNERFDANDILWRDDALAAFNVAAALPSVKAKVLVVGIVEDELFPPKEATQPLADAIPGAKVFLYESKFGHLGCALDIGKANAAILSHITAAEGR